LAHDDGDFIETLSKELVRQFLAAPHDVQTTGLDSYADPAPPDAPDWAMIRDDAS